ncbi:unnamed protein product [Rotaria socialis]|uniref:N-acetyltransferase domain-containing protein n=1 Tax=Rotaria socialis TaxID=392032 RepID=A0A820IWZ5_9BILA|nr:unnamed protein product [Rotaria socialis]CAF4317843.1 unnamed protein product [Rotaria socialis]
MFTSKKDFALLARQVQLSSREVAAAAATTTATETSTPFLVDVYQVRLWKLLTKPDKADVEAIGQTFKCNPQELLHTIVALYDNSLSDIGGETIYSTICSPKVVTILVVFDNPHVVLKEPTITPIVIKEDDCLDTLLENVEYPDSVFKEVFSDSSSSESSDDDDDDSGSDDNEHDYSVGVGKFLEKVAADKINFNKRLIGCLSFQKITTFPITSQEEHVLDLQLMACRKKYRGHGIGRHLLKLIMNNEFVGEYDAIVTASDQSAIDFYRKFGFTEDAIILSKYKAIGDCWTNTTKMCYLPPYNVVNEDPIRCLTIMDDQFQKWQKTMFSSYQNQAALFNRLKNEMIGLYAKINTQDQIIVSLNRTRFLLAKENASLKLKLSGSKSSGDENNEDIEELETHQMVQEMEKMSITNEKLLIAQMSLLVGDDCNTPMAIEFCRHKLRNPGEYEIKAKKITIDLATIALYKSGLASLHHGSPKSETLLFYFGHHDHLEIIVTAGFTNEDFLYGSFGKGLYFHSTLRNLQIQKPQKFLLCKVALGRTELVSKQKSKSTITLKRNIEYDSVKIFDMDTRDDGDDDDELVIFDSHLALPLFIITLE